MIRELTIKNLALIKNLTIEFSNGFTVFTGETGAGKSILIGAIGLLLGERASAEMVRSGCDEAEVNGVLEFNQLKSTFRAALEELNIDIEDGELIITRKISRSGRNKILVNQSPVPLSCLKKLGCLLIDLHGQHEHQSLLDETTHLELIDRLPEVRAYRVQYSKDYDDYVSAIKELKTVQENTARLVEKKELLEFQYSELSTIKLQAGEEEKLESELSLLTSSADRIACASHITKLVNSGSESVYSKLSQIKKDLQTFIKYDASVQPWLTDIENALSICSDLDLFCNSYLDKNSETDPTRIEFINSRLAKIQRLKKKYSCSLEQLIAKRDALGKDLSTIENTDFEEKRLKEIVGRSRESCLESGQKLRTARINAAKSFDRKITELMSTLGFKGGEWYTEIKELKEPEAGGLDNVRFLVKTNPGEPFLPLCKSASGGEISRLMLAVKSVFAEHDQIPVLIFDEIDTGIGGVLAGEVAKTLRSLSSTHQVLCISHLHQIASVADNHFVVEKIIEDNRTETVVKALGHEEKVNEIARMLGGDSTISKQHAQELLNSTPVEKG
ncbi:DNA repair protein RecN [Chitinispirillales bacterium ANBcel5]|uniref:DNA repair protein RecN n=1 Tax=Cellulosispirillum alkaliphilum TaxID=3039283 RepID=UPI002A5929F1|nr:DNA repair protein RecN [Chitinispirillales bacterium ANBcel5]